MNLEINNLSVSVFNQPVLKSITLSIKPGTTHAIMGPNGSGKSTLAYALMGHPNYQITAGSIVLQKKEITDLSPDKRAQGGLFLAFQQPQAIPGVRVLTFLKEAYHAMHGKSISVQDFQQLLFMRMKQLLIDSSFASRNLNDGFSGGERKRFELLQLLLLQPNVAVLDEIDSGLDIDALKIVSNGIAIARKENPRLSIILITHYQRILQYVAPDYVHVLCDGRIVESGNASLAQELEQKGYDGFRQKEYQNTAP